MLKNKPEDILNEGDFSVLRNPSPYRVGRAPGFVRNDDAALKRSYLMRRAEEENNYYQTQQLFGQLEQLDPMFQNLFRQIVDVRNFVESQKLQPLATKEQLNALNELTAHLDSVSKILSVDCINTIDKLGNNGLPSTEPQYM